MRPHRGQRGAGRRQRDQPAPCGRLFGVGPGLTLGSLVWFSFADTSTGYFPDLLVPSVLFGIGVGLVLTTAAGAATTTGDRGQAGVASGLLNTSQNLGGTLGQAPLVAVSHAVATRSLAADPLAAVSDGYSAAFLAAAGIVALGLVAAVFTPGRPEPES